MKSYNFGKAGRSLRIATGIITFAVLLLAGSECAVALTVDDSSGADYTKIQDVVDDASAWNTILITNDTYSDQEPVIIRRSNGELFVTFNSGGGDRKNALYRSTSINNGTNWSISRFAVNGWSDLGLIEDANGRLVLLVQDGEIYSWVSSDGGQTWSNKRIVTPTSINGEAGSIISAQNGYYYVSYSNSVLLSSPGDVYVTRSLDLSTWENPVQVSSGSNVEFDSSLLQTSDGKFYLAYNSYTDNAIVIAVSNDGQTWNTMQKILTSVGAHMGINLIEIESKPVLFYCSRNNLYYSFLNVSTWVSPQQIFSPSPFGVDAVLLEDGSVGIAYTNEVESQRDIFFTNLGRLNLPSPTAGSISGMKWNDSDSDGVKDVNESGLANWTIVLTMPNGTTTRTTSNATGNYSFTNLPAGNYTVGEEVQQGWKQTAPSTGTYNVTITSAGEDFTGKDFGNFHHHHHHHQRYKSEFHESRV